MFCNVAADAVFTAQSTSTPSTAAAPAARSKGSTTSSASCSTSGRARRGSTRGSASSRSASRSPSARSTIGVRRQVRRSSIESYKSLNEALLHGGIANDARVEIRYIDSEEIEKRRRRRSSRSRRHPRRARLRRARHRRQDRGDSLRAREAGAVLRHLLRHAAGVRRVRAPRVRPRPGANSTEIDPNTPHPGRRRSCPISAASPTRARRCASAPIRACSSAGTQRRRGLRHAPRSASATAIARK